MATNIHGLVEENACNSSQDVCMGGECELCLTSNLSLSDFDEETKTISFLNWQRVDKNIAKINQSLTFDQAIEKWNSTILTIKKHISQKRKQVASCNQQKLDLKPGEALIHVDYSEGTICLLKRKNRSTPAPHSFLLKQPLHLLNKKIFH